MRACRRVVGRGGGRLMGWGEVMYLRREGTIWDLGMGVREGERQRGREGKKEREGGDGGGKSIEIEKEGKLLYVKQYY